MFQHIPKTAGVSVRSVMACNFRAQDVLHVPDARWRDAPFALAAAERYRFIHGHVQYEFLRDIIHATRVVTFLREPVDRVLSLYFFLRAQTVGPNMSPGALLAVEQAKLKSIEEFVSDPHPMIAAMITNYQVQMLITAAEIERGRATWVRDAVENLRSYAFVGIADAHTMPRALAAMARVFGWVVSRDSPRVNQTTRSRNAHQLRHARRLIAERNELDLALYERVCAHFKKSLCTSRTQLTRARQMSRVEIEQYRTGLISPVTMDQPLRGFGWHDRELGERTCWRCAAQLRVGLDLKLPHESRIGLLFNLKAVHARIAIEETELLVGTQVLPSRVFRAENTLVIATLLPGRIVGSDGILPLVISCKEGTSAVSGTHMSADSRYVTFALDRIDVITETTVGPRPLAVLEEWLLKPADRLAETDRAERPSGGCAPLPEELSRLQTETRPLLDGGSSERAAFIERIEASQNYCKALSDELKRQQTEKAALVQARLEDRAETERYQASLIERIEASQNYCKALGDELKRQQTEKAALVQARLEDRMEAERYQVSLIERAKRSEAYAASLMAEITRLRDAKRGRTEPAAANEPQAESGAMSTTVAPTNN